jgi:hypothetical protein
MTERTEPMTEDEKATIMMKYWELREAGKETEAHAIITQIPIPPYLAKTAKKAFGSDFLVKGGYNLSEAEVEYGQGWLTRQDI